MRIINVAQLAHIMMTGRGCASIQKRRIGRTLRMKLMCANAGGKVMIVSEYFTFEGESYVKASTYDEVLYKLKRANDKVSDLKSKLEKSEAENTSLMDSHIKLYNDAKDTIRCLKDENTSLKHRLQNMIDVCDGSCFLDEQNDRDKLIAELQDQHQQDCIRYNDMRTAYLVTLDELARLREQFGIG